jgi:hypothetical protein
VTAWIAGLLLIVAAVLKARALAQAPHQPIWTVLQAYAECVLGLWLLTGLWAGGARRIGLVTFALFAIVALAQWTRGAESCGCFGQVVVPPWIMLALDLTVVAGLALARPAARSSGVPRQRLAAACFSVVIGLALVSWLARPRVALLQVSDGTDLGDGAVVVLEPMDWAGQRLPLLPHLGADGERLAEGEWTVLLYHQGCPACQAKLQDLARGRAPSGPHLAVIQVGDGSPDGPAAADQALWLKLTPDRRWFAETPIVLGLKDGVVVAVHLRDAPAPATTQTSPSEPIRPVLAQTLADGSYRADLGYVPAGATWNVVIELLIGEDQSFPLASVNSECACLTVTSHTAEAVAGQRLPIALGFDAPHESGPYAKKLTLIPAGSQHAPMDVLVQARVGQPLSITPQTIRLADLTPGPVELIVRNDGDAPVRLLYATASPWIVTAAVPKAPVPARGEIRLPVALHAETSPQPGVLRIVTASAQQASLEVPFE